MNKRARFVWSLVFIVAFALVSWFVDSGRNRVDQPKWTTSPPTPVKITPPGLSSNSSSGRFTSERPDTVSLVPVPLDECKTYDLTVERVRMYFQDEIKARVEVSGISGAVAWDPAKLARHTYNARRIIEQARRCRGYSDVELRLTEDDLQITGLKPVRSKRGKP